MGLVIVIEPHGTYAIYEQIVNQIKNQIISGELQPDRRCRPFGDWQRISASA